MELREPHEVYEYYDWQNHQREINRLKNTRCKDCDHCYSELVDFDEAGSLEVGFCDHDKAFLTLEDMNELTAWDCLKDEI